mgnify:CR=1 FL=1
MSNEDLFAQISADLGSGRKDGVSSKILMIAESTDDPYEVLKCLSLLKLVEDEGTESKLCDILLGMADQSNGLEICTSLRNLDLPETALTILKKMEPSDRSLRLECQCLYDMEEYESAMDKYSKIQNPVINDRILFSSIQSAVGEYNAAVDTATALLEEYPTDYDVRIAYVNALLRCGKDKEAAKYARNAVKDKTADSNAIAAYVLRIAGNTKAAAGYATRAINLDNNHIGAMETLGICLAAKQEYDKARIVAGAINEISPGNKAALNILANIENS